LEKGIKEMRINWSCCFKVLLLNAMGRKIKQQLTTTALHSFMALSHQEGLLHPIRCRRAPARSPPCFGMRSLKLETLPRHPTAASHPLLPRQAPFLASADQEGPHHGVHVTAWLRI